MCTQKSPYNWSEQLYQRHGETISNYLKRSVLPALQDRHGEFLLTELVQRGSNHTIMNKWHKKFFMYLVRMCFYLWSLFWPAWFSFYHFPALHFLSLSLLFHLTTHLIFYLSYLSFPPISPLQDRYHVKYHQLPSLEDAGLRYFKSIVFDAIKAEVTDSILTLINNEREGVLWVWFVVFCSLMFISLCLMWYLLKYKCLFGNDMVWLSFKYTFITYMHLLIVGIRTLGQLYIIYYNDLLTSPSSSQARWSTRIWFAVAFRSTRQWAWAVWKFTRQTLRRSSWSLRGRKSMFCVFWCIFGCICSFMLM